MFSQSTRSTCFSSPLRYKPCRFGIVPGLSPCDARSFLYTHTSSRYPFKARSTPSIWQYLMNISSSSIANLITSTPLPVEVYVEIFLNVETPESWAMTCRFFHCISIDPILRAQFLMYLI